MNLTKLFLFLAFALFNLTIVGCGKPNEQKQDEQIIEAVKKQTKDSLANLRTFVIRPTRVNGTDCLIRYSDKLAGIKIYSVWILDPSKDEVIEVTFTKYKIKIDPQCEVPKIKGLSSDFKSRTSTGDSKITIISNSDIIDICSD
jgi:hypothetical protein